MIIRKFEKEEYRPCSCCKKEHRIYDRNKWLCKKCYEKKKKEKYDRITSSKYNNDLRNVFTNIWQNREHVCYHCGKKILNPQAINFSHILSRNCHPRLRCESKNIILVCADCHRIYEFGDRSMLKRQISQELIDELLNIERNGNQKRND